MVAPPFSINGLYAITPDEIDTGHLCLKVSAAINGGARMVQYRNKAADKQLRLQQASALLALCRSLNVPLIINDQLDLCAQIDADGLHLGATDCDLGAARRLLGARKIIGASCYNRLKLAEDAQRAGASYVAFGAFFASTTKPDATPAPLSLIAAAKKTTKLPIVAIGGITLDNISSVLQAGADSVAVSQALFGVDHVQAVSQQFSSQFL